MRTNLDRILDSGERWDEEIVKFGLCAFYVMLICAYFVQFGCPPESESPIIIVCEINYHSIARVVERLPFSSRSGCE